MKKILLLFILLFGTLVGATSLVHAEELEEIDYENKTITIDTETRSIAHETFEFLIYLIENDLISSVVSDAIDNDFIEIVKSESDIIINFSSGQLIIVGDVDSSNKHLAYGGPNGVNIITITYDLPTYEVAFDEDLEMDPILVFQNEVIEEMPENPTKTGYIFNGWYTDEARTVAFNAEDPITSDITLYAKWVASTNGGGTGGTGGNEEAEINHLAIMGWVVAVIGVGVIFVELKKRR